MRERKQNSTDVEKNNRTQLQFWWNLADKSKVGEIFEVEILVKTSQTTLLQIPCTIVLNYKVIIKTISVPIKISDGFLNMFNPFPSEVHTRSHNLEGNKTLD